MVHRILVRKRLSPRSEGRAWPGSLGSSLNFHLHVSNSQLWLLMALNMQGAWQEAVCFQALPLKVWSMDQQHGHHWEACYKCRLTSSTPKLSNQNLHFSKNDSNAHWTVRSNCCGKVWSWSGLSSNPYSATYLSKSQSLKQAKLRHKWSGEEKHVLCHY